MKSKEQRRIDAEQRQAVYDPLTTSQKLARAVARGHSGTREARRLAELLRQERQS